LIRRKPSPKRKRAPVKKTARRGPAKPAAVGDILQNMIDNTLLGRQLEQARIWENWGAIVGPQMAAHGRPHSVKDKTLRIEVDSMVWMHRYAYKKFAILRKINQMAQAELVSEVFFMLGDGETFEE